MLESLAELLLKPGPNSTTELFFSFGQQGFVAFLKAPDFFVLHRCETLFHFRFEVGFNLAQPMLQRLVVVQTKAFLLQVQPTVVFLVKLRFNGGLDLGFSLLKSLVLLHAVLVVDALNLAFKSQVELLANPCFFCGQSVPLHRFQFCFHVAAQLVFERIQRQLVLHRKVLGDVRLHGVDALGDGLLAKPSFSTKVSA